MNLFIQIERKVMHRLAQNFQQHTLHDAVQDAYASFAKQYPEWTASLFDEHFVFSKLMPILEHADRAALTVTPGQVALLWSQQFSSHPTQQAQRVATALPIATHFLALIAVALSTSRQSLPLPGGAWLPQAPAQGTQGLSQPAS